MNGMLGKITKVRKVSRNKASDRLHRMEVSFKPVCIMPGREAAPEWLKDQTLKVTRTVVDPRELGGIGDSIVLTPAESEGWLRPLRVDPPMAFAKPPARLKLTLRWWKDKKPGEFTVVANGRRKTGKFAKAGSGGKFAASVTTRDLFGVRPPLPADLKVTFKKLTGECNVLPAGGCYHHKIRTPGGPRHRVRSNWYALDVCADRAGGGITMLREVGRDVDHFRTDGSFIGRPLDYGGHRDRVDLGWSERLRGTEMTSVTARRDGTATRLCLDGVIDKDRNIHTTAACTVFDRLPLVLLQRDVLLHKREKKDDKKDRKKCPGELIDDVARVALGFRAAFAVEKNGSSGSRILSVDEGRFAVVRPVQMHDFVWNGWRLTEGWAVVEHPGRRECMMYLFDGGRAPVLGTWLGNRVLTLEPYWPPQPVRPECGAGFSLAIIAGELCGAGAGGAWVACRRPGDDDGVCCALVGRFREAPAEPATIALGRQTAAAPLERTFLPGVGEVFTASVHLPKGRMNSRLDITAGGIPARRAR